MRFLRDLVPHFAWLHANTGPYHLARREWNVGITFEWMPPPGWSFDIRIRLVWRELHLSFGCPF